MKPAVLVLSTFLLTSCFHVKNQLYNPASTKPPKPPASVVRVFADHDKPDPDCDPADPGHNACLAFLEFDEMGEMWDPAQLEKAIGLIEKAKQVSTHPIIVTFTHGWKNNARDEPGHVTGNVFGFEGILDYLENPTDQNRRPTHRFADSPVVGIYVAWRGDLVSKYWPVRRQLSYFNREGAAIRIPGASLTGALTRIMMVTHSGPPGARVIMVGHSFGGLVMERALTQAMADFVLRGGTASPDVAAARMGLSPLDITPEIKTAFSLSESRGVFVAGIEPGSVAAQAGIELGDVILQVGPDRTDSSKHLKTILAQARVGDKLPVAASRKGLGRTMTLEVTQGPDGAWADLVVFVNSAAAASEGKQMLDLLKNKGLEYSVTPEAKRLEAAETGRERTRERPLFLSISSLGDIATRFGLFIGHGPSAVNRSFKGSWRTYDKPEPKEVPSQRSYYLSTTAHMPVLQSHLIVEDNPGGRAQCGPMFSDQPVTITTGQRYVICEKPERWNETPYWAMQMPATIVPDHGGIFNQNFLALLLQFLPTEAEMLNPNRMPALRFK